MTINISIKMPTSSVIEKQILGILKKKVDIVLNDSIVGIERGVRSILRDALISSPEVDSLINGKLRGELGLPDGASRVIALINLWVSTVTVQVSKTRVIGNMLKASLKVYAVQKDWKDALASPAATLITEKGQSLPWLEWLLLLGSSIIIKDYEVSLGSPTHSRTGTAIMVKGKGRRWRVPPEFSGTARNNFVTRAIELAQPKILVLMEAEVKKQAK